MQGVQVCAHSIDQLEILLAFYRDQNFENRTIFDLDRQLKFFFKSQKWYFWKTFGPKFNFYYIKWTPNSQILNSRSFPSPQKPRVRRT